MKYSPVVIILFIENATVSSVESFNNASVEFICTPIEESCRAARLNTNVELKMKLKGEKAINAVSDAMIASCSERVKYIAAKIIAAMIMFADSNVLDSDDIIFEGTSDGNGDSADDWNRRLADGDGDGID